MSSFSFLRSARSIDYSGRWLHTVIFTGIMAAIDRSLPEMSMKTRTLLRAQLPRPKLIKAFLVASAVPGGADSRQRADKDYEEFMSRGMGASDGNSMWFQGAWQMLANITFKVEEPGDCARRTCEKRRSTEVSPLTMLYGALINYSRCQMSSLPMLVVRVTRTG